MTDKVIENNQVVVMGTIVSDFVYSHEIFGEGFYMVDVEVERLSDSSDIIPVMVSERLLNVEQDYKGYMIAVTGQFRSYNRHEEKKNRLILSVFAETFSLILLGLFCKSVSTLSPIFSTEDVFNNLSSTFAYISSGINISVGFSDT